MKKIVSVCIAVLCLCAFLSVYAQHSDDNLNTAEPAAESLIPPQSMIVMEKSTARVLCESNSRQKLPMASTTKIMTAIVALEEGNTADNVTVSAAADGVEGSSMYLRQGEIMSLEDLLYGLMLSSGNDAAVAIAEHVGGNVENFVGMMNQKAKEIGADDTHFDNPNGLPSEKHYSTAYDMALIAAYGLENETFAKIVATKEITISGYGKQFERSLVNHNKLLKLYPECIGVKTGYTKEAGRCLVSAAKRDNMTLICVTLNAPNDWNDHINCYNECFRKFSMRQVELPDEESLKFSVKDGTLRECPAELQIPCYFPLESGENPQTEVVLDKRVCAPVMKGDIVGTLKVTADGRECGSIKLVAPQEIPIRNFEFVHISETLISKIEDIYQFWLSMFENKFVK